MTAFGDVFYIVDFDRTLADTDKLLDIFLQVADEYISIPREQIEATAEDVKRRGDSFDTAGYVRDHLMAEGRGDDWDKLAHWYIRESQSLDMLLPGGAELLALFQAQSLGYGILTYGNPLWQRLKLSAAGFHRAPHIIMTTKAKSRLIKSWQRNGKFYLPQEFGAGEAGRIVLIDDKAVSFEGFPGGPSTGYWVLPQGHELPSQRGGVPENVTRVESLYEVVEVLGRAR